jgi:hypothetical protein
MRKPEDLCLLCKENPAAKTNSHIFPKFLSSKFLGLKSSKRGFQLSSDQKENQAPKIVQDSPKENYILCPDCEMYFSIIESATADSFINWKQKVARGEFFQQTYPPGFSIVLCNSTHPSILRLLVYSILWRASISTNSLFQNISVSENILESLRTSLMAYKSNSLREYFIKLDDPSELKLFPYAMITADSFTSETSNVLFVPPFHKAYKIIVDQFCFLLFPSPQEIPVDLFKRASNIRLNDKQMIVFPEKLWKDTIVQPVINLLAQEIKKNR